MATSGRMLGGLIGGIVGVVGGFWAMLRHEPILGDLGAFFLFLGSLAVGSLSLLTGGVAGATADPWKGLRKGALWSLGIYLSLSIPVLLLAQMDSSVVKFVARTLVALVLVGAVAGGVGGGVGSLLARMTGGAATDKTASPAP